MQSPTVITLSGGIIAMNLQRHKEIIFDCITKAGTNRIFEMHTCVAVVLHWVHDSSSAFILSRNALEVDLGQLCCFRNRFYFKSPCED